MPSPTVNARYFDSFKLNKADTNMSFMDGSSSMPSVTVFDAPDSASINPNDSTATGACLELLKELLQDSNHCSCLLLGV